jgi:hypothetical protein
MLAVKILLLILICDKIHGKFLKLEIQVENRDEKVMNYVKNVVEDMSAQDSITRDVVLLRLGRFSGSKRRVDDIYSRGNIEN